MQIDTVLLFFIAFGTCWTAVAVLEGNRKTERLNDRLQVFWEEYVRKGGANRHDDF